MDIICKDNEITIRKLENSTYDMDCLLKWMNNKNVSTYYGDCKEYTIDEIRNKYEKRVNSEWITSCIIEFNKIPIGYIQFYIVDDEEYEIPKEFYKMIFNEYEKTMAIDLFIGNDEYRDKGIGTRTIKLLIDEIFKDYSVDAILIDPRTSNKRAIECYKKCGFKEMCIIPKRDLKDGIKFDSLIMKIVNYNKTMQKN